MWRGYNSLPATMLPRHLKVLREEENVWGPSIRCLAWAWYANIKVDVHSGSTHPGFLSVMS